MRKNWVLLGIIVIISIALLLPACSSPTATSAPPAPKTTAAVSAPQSSAPSTTVAAPKPTTAASIPAAAPSPAASPSSTRTGQYGGTLKIIARGTVQNMGYPGANFGPDDGTFQSPAVEKLVTVDTKGVTIPNLATSWQISPDYKYITLNLRKGVKFHDGTDFNAAAVKYNLDLFLNGPRPDLKTISSIDVVDNYTIRMNFKSYDPALIPNFWAAVGWIVSPTAVESKGKDWALNNPVGTGPYKFVSYTRDVSVKFTRFDDYWGGKPYLDNLEYTLISDPVTALAAFKAGEAQASIIVGNKDAAEMLASGKYNVAKIATQVYGLAFDSANAANPFSKLQVRQALAYAIDNAAIAKSVGYGFYTPTNQVATPGGYCYNQEIAGYPYNPPKAKQLLAAAGYPNGFKTTLTFQVNPENQDTVTAVQAYLSQVGITANLDPADQSRFVGIYSNQSGWNNAMLFPIGIAASLGSDPGRGLMTPMSSKRARFWSIDIPADYDKLLLEANTEPDAAKRQTEFRTISKMITDQYAMITPIYVQWWIGVSTTQVHEFTMNGVAPGVWYPQNVWLSK